jgi:hypothetical protein
MGIAAKRCIRWHRRQGGLEGPADLAEDFDDWIVDSDRELICPFCQTHEDRIADAARTIAGLDQLGIIRRDWSTDAA